MDVKTLPKENGIKMIRGINILFYESKGKKAVLPAPSVQSERPALQEMIPSMQRPPKQNDHSQEKNDLFEAVAQREISETVLN